MALSFDPWQHGERGRETRDELAGRVFGAFRRHMWPILGHTTLDALRVLFLCGEKDTHVPADGALRFQAALGRAHPEAADRVRVEMIPGLAHLDVREPSRWWPICRRWLAADVD